MYFSESGPFKVESDTEWCALSWPLYPSSLPNERLVIWSWSGLLLSTVRLPFILSSLNWLSKLVGNWTSIAPLIASNFKVLADVVILFTFVLMRPLITVIERSPDNEWIELWTLELIPAILVEPEVKPCFWLLIHDTQVVPFGYLLKIKVARDHI